MQNIQENDQIKQLEKEIERLQEALHWIVEVTNYGTKTSTTMSEFAVNNANILARSALQQNEAQILATNKYEAEGRN